MKPTPWLDPVHRIVDRDLGDVGEHIAAAGGGIHQHDYSRVVRLGGRQVAVSDGACRRSHFHLEGLLNAKPLCLDPNRHNQEATSLSQPCYRNEKAASPCVDHREQRVAVQLTPGAPGVQNAPGCGTHHARGGRSGHGRAPWTACQYSRASACEAKP